MKESDTDKERLNSEFNEFTAKHWHENLTILPIIITGHLYLEKSLNKLLEATLRDTKPLDRFSFTQKVAVLESIGLVNKESITRLLNFNKIRNKFAHDLDYDLTYDDMLTLNIEGLTRKAWDDNTTRILSQSLSYMIGYLHGQIVVVSSLKRQKKPIL